MTEVEQYHQEQLTNTPEFLDAKILVAREELESEAWALISDRSSQSHPEVRMLERQDNARTALMEALTASGHLSRVEITGELDEINAQVLSRLLNGWDESLPGHEKQRRFAEIVNELYIQRVHRAMAAEMLPMEVAVLEESDWPEALAGLSLGYRDANRKGMSRSTHLSINEDGKFTRVIETVSRSNSHWNSTFRFLQQSGAEIESGYEPDVAALRTPILYTTEQLAAGIVDVQRILDKASGANIRYGEIIGTNEGHVDYAELREESIRRESQINHYIETLASYEERLDRQLEAGTIDIQQRQSQYAEQVRICLRSICALTPEYSLDCFGDAAAPYYYAASQSIAQGDMDRAMALIYASQAVEESITFCGVTLTPERAAELGLTLGDVKKLTEDAKENWKWKQGVCQVQTCPTRPGKTEVGPCSVCRSCQAKFDKGGDPTKTPRKVAAVSIGMGLAA